MPAKARCQITVRHYECDPLGHVNHAMYVHYFEVGRLTAMADAGLPFSAILKQGYTVVAVDIYVQYKMPGLFGRCPGGGKLYYRFPWRADDMAASYPPPRRWRPCCCGGSEWRFYAGGWASDPHPSAMRTLLETVYVPDAVPLLPRQRRGPSA